MGLQLPGWLRQALEYVGYDWPATDESVLFQWGGDWGALAGQSHQMIAQVEQGIAQVQSANQGQVATNFATYMQGEAGNLASLKDFAATMGPVAAAHYVAAGIVLAMKIAVIVQLVILAYAIAAAIATAGLASGAAIAARQAAKWAIEAAINIAVEQILAA